MKPCTMLLLTMLLASAHAKISPEDVAKLLEASLEWYKQAQEDFDKMMGIKAFAETLADLESRKAEVHEHLSVEEKTAYQKLTKAQSLSRVATASAEVVKRTIHTQMETLVRVFEVGSTPQQQIQFVANTFLMNLQALRPAVQAARDQLFQADEAITDAQNTLSQILVTLRRVSKNLVDEREGKREKRKKQAMSKHWCWLAGGVGCLITIPVVDHVTNKDIEKIIKHYNNLIETVDTGTAGFRGMQTITGRLKDQLEKKIKEMIVIEAGLIGIETPAQLFVNFGEEYFSDLRKLLLDRANALLDKCSSALPNEL